MLIAGWTPTLVPFGADQTIYVVIDSFGRGSCDCESQIERADLESVTSDLMAGQFNNPVRVVAFNTLEHWSKDISQEVAEEIQVRCDIENVPVPEDVRDFVERYTRRASVPAEVCAMA